MDVMDMFSSLRQYSAQIIRCILAVNNGYLEVDLRVIVGSHWLHICSSLVKLSCICSLAIE